MLLTICYAYDTPQTTLWRKFQNNLRDEGMILTLRLVDLCWNAPIVTYILTGASCPAEMSGEGPVEPTPVRKAAGAPLLRRLQLQTATGRGGRVRANETSEFRKSGASLWWGFDRGNAHDQTYALSRSGILFIHWREYLP